MPNNLKSRTAKIEQAIRAKEEEVLLIWRNSFSEGFPLKKTIDSLTRPIAARGFDTRQIPYSLNSQTKAWILQNWHQIVPEAREIRIEKDEEIQSRFGPQET